jgi:glutaminyl-peptide cyclotransferase
VTPSEPLRRLRALAAVAARELRVRLGQPRRAPIETVCSGHPAPAGPAAFDAERAWALLTRQCEIGPRIPGSAGHRRTLAWMLDQLRAVAAEVALQRWRQRIFRGPGAGTRPEMSNLLARIPGREPGQPLMLAAHWDTRPVADQDPDPARRGEPVPGANDGASGVAVVLEAARAIAAAGPPRDVIVCLFDGEDLGDHYYGSRLYARWVQRREAARWRPARAVVADMVGKRALRCASETHSRTRAPALWAELMRCAAELGLTDHFGGPESAINDDHVSLLRIGIPAVLLIDYTYPQWHTTADTAEQCDAGSLAVVGRTLVHLAMNRE